MSGRYTNHRGRPRKFTEMQVFEIRRLRDDVPKSWAMWRVAREAQKELGLFDFSLTAIYEVLTNGTCVDLHRGQHDQQLGE